MPGMKDALKGAGFQAQQPQGSSRTGQRAETGGRLTVDDSLFPDGYPKYFKPNDQKPNFHTRVELLLGEAENLAMRFERDGLKRHQLRAFYDHAKRQLQRLQHGADFADVQPEIAKLKYFAADRAGRGENALPLTFKTFIDRNVAAIKDRADFERGFMPHFEAVVAYCARIRE